MRRDSKLAFLPDIPGLFFLITFSGLVFFNKGRVLNDGDTFWHIKAGLTMLEQGSLLTKDIFSHTAYGMPWTAHEWLAEIFMASIYRLTDLQGVAIFYFFIASLSFWLLFKISRRYAGEWISLFCVLLAYRLSLSHLIARPHIFSWLFGILTLYILLEGEKKLYFLPLITALWANFHGGFILGLALQGFFIGGSFLEYLQTEKKLPWGTFWSKERLPILVMLASILTSGINPFGYHLLIFPFLVTQKIFSSGITEWLSPNMQEKHLFRYYLLGVLFLVSLPRTETSWTNRLLLLFFLNAALVHQRNISIASMVLTPFFAKSLTRFKMKIHISALQKGKPKNLKLSALSGPLTTTVLFLILMMANCSVFPLGQRLFQAIIPIPKEYHPIDMVAFLNTNPLSGNMFNQYSWGGYLIYALDPPQKVFIDGRADMYGEKIFKDFQKISRVDKEINNLLDSYKIRMVLFPGDTPLVRYLRATDQWQEVYRDDEASVLLRKPDLNQ